MASLTKEGQPGRESNDIRNRSFGGCTTCRSRHVKCDEIHPACSTCKQIGLLCGGYEKEIFFDPKSSPSNGRIRFRRPLFTEGERQRMSQWLVSSVPPRFALQFLSQIDEECENADTVHDIQIHRGPFGAFRLSHDRSTISSNTLSCKFETPGSLQQLIQVNDDYPYSSDAALSPWAQTLIHSILEQSDEIPTSSLPELWNMSMDSGRIQEVFDGMDLPENQEFSISPFASQGYRCSQLSMGTQCNYLTPETSISSVTSTNNFVPQDAVFLLKHYSSTVISLLTPFRHTKTPFHVLFIPHVKNCLAALTLGEYLDHASLSTFYGTLALSAFSFGGVSQSQMWLEQGRTYRQRALEHLRLMLQTAYDVPKVSKYKSVLMAILTAVQMSMFCGNREQTETYFLEAEKLIRIKGLKRKKSRKVRLLHHWYAFNRMIHETTFIGGANSRQRHHVREAVKSSALDICGQDSLSFRLPSSWINLDQAMMEVKSQEEGENDLHLEKPGLFIATLYPEIFGIPEIYVQLLSLTIRLGNEKDAVEQQADIIDCLSLKDFVNRAKDIERRINRLQQPTQTHIPDTNTNTSADIQSQTDRNILENILGAVHSALAIYFYRRIYDLDASMLQEKVVKVRDCLLHCENADPDVVHGSAVFIWPAFIAASEAEDQEVQLSFSKWFNNSARRSGLLSFTNTLKRIEQIWQEKRINADGTSVTWLDLTKKDFLLQQQPLTGHG